MLATPRIHDNITPASSIPRRPWASRKGHDLRLGESDQNSVRNPACHAPPKKPVPSRRTHLESPQACRARIPEPAPGGGGGFLQLLGGELRPQLAAALIQQGRLRRKERPKTPQDNNFS